MADISSLNLNPPAEIDYALYKDSGEYRRPPIEGRYFVQAPSSFKVDGTMTWDKDTILVYANKEGILSACIDGAVITNSQVEGANGFRVDRKWINVKRSAKKESTSLDDYLRAHGINAAPQMVGKPAAERNAVYASLLESTVGRLFEVATKWEGACQDCDENNAQAWGMANFPKDDKGIKAVFDCKHCKKPIFAALKVYRFINKVEKAAAAGAVAKSEPAYA